MLAYYQECHETKHTLFTTLSICNHFVAIHSWKVCRNPKSQNKLPFSGIQGHERSLLSVQSKASVRFPISDYQ